MSEYVLRKGLHFYEIAKFEDTDSPTAIYKFTTRGCSCPAGRRSCKHTKILNKWKQDNEPAGHVYNDSAEVIAILPVT